ncbi:hypothetical protein BLNAU_22235 [Blattamonas nauphoetae]|uniref:Uncharacterized protein n=1 Tax=Blattamonas nauphoetae TaxID=2049346 RepID=A0ABQ9WWQ4_9EUKA|nr:hypothetical protein BLNAU_22235 [Blattamonas nauphoetae]
MSMCVLSKEEGAAELRNQKREKWERERKEREQRKRGYSPQPTLEYFPFVRGGGGAPLRDEKGRIVLAKDVLNGRQSAINNHPTHEQAQLSPPYVERIPRQDRQPHKEEPAIRPRAVPMEEREVVADAVESVTERAEAEEARSRERGRDGRDEEGERRERKGDGRGERRSRSEGGREGVSIPLPVPSALVNDAPNGPTARANTRHIDARHTNNGSENRKILLDGTAYSDCAAFEM